MQKARKKKANTMSDNVIHNADEFDAYIKSRQNKALFDRDANGQLKVDHIGAANAMVKMIMLTPMDKWVKRVMIMRIGDPTKKEKPRTHMQVALSLGMMEQEVIEAEQYGMKVVGDFMNRVSSTEFADRFNKEQTLRSQVEDIQNKKVNSEENPTA